MKTSSFALIAVASCLTATAPSAWSATLPITFEQPAYSPGSVIDQDGWLVLAPHAFVGDGIDVVNTNLISGAQSLHVPGGSITHAAATKVGQLTDISWLVRVDNSGGGNFETGLAHNVEFGSAATPLTIMFAANGQLQYYNAVTDTNTNYDGDPTWSLGIVYRIEATDVDYDADTYHIKIFDTNANTAVVDQSLPFASPNDTNPAWYVLNRGDSSASATVDDFMEIPSTPLVPGDFDGDGDVDGADFVAWQTNFPKATDATLADGDADGDGDVDGADFVVWQTNFPFTPSPGIVPVPEPMGWLLLSIGSIGLIAARKLKPRG